MRCGGIEPPAFILNNCYNMAHPINAINVNIHILIIYSIPQNGLLQSTRRYFQCMYLLA